MDHSALSEHVGRDEICRIGRSLFERGYVHATAGNISLRLGDGRTLITPTDACLGFLDPAALALVDTTGRVIGSSVPSKTIVLHRRIQAADPLARCIVHTHSTHCVALTLLDQRGSAPRVQSGPGPKPTPTPTPSPNLSVLPPITPYFVMKVGPVPLLPYHRPGDPAVGDLAVAAIEAAAERGVKIRAVLLARLGPVVWNTTPTAAMATLEELEETARLWWLTRSESPSDGIRHNPLDLVPDGPSESVLKHMSLHLPELSVAELDELRRVFGATW